MKVRTPYKLLRKLFKEFVIFLLTNEHFLVTFEIANLNVKRCTNVKMKSRLKMETEMTLK